MNHVIIIKNAKQICVPVIDETIDPMDTLIWDTRLDGKLPDGMDYEIVSRLGNSLFEDPIKKTKKEESLAIEKSEQERKKQERIAMRAEKETLRMSLEAETITSAQLRRFLKLYLKLKGE